jgi:YbgC/YbaW family acyl-CoA thioester hydrolase
MFIENLFASIKNKPMSGPIFQHQHRVVYAECTVGNHVYYSRYLDMLEAARGELFRQAGWTLLTLRQEGTAFPVIETRIAYKKAAQYDDLLAIQLWITELHGIRLTFGFSIRDAGGSVVAEGQTRHVCAGLDGKPKRPSPGLVSALAKLLRKENEKS